MSPKGGAPGSAGGTCTDRFLNRTTLRVAWKNKSAQWNTTRITHDEPHLHKLH